MTYVVKELKIISVLNFFYNFRYHYFFLNNYWKPELPLQSRFIVSPYWINAHTHNLLLLRIPLKVFRKRTTVYTRKCIILHLAKCCNICDLPTIILVWQRTLARMVPAISKKTQIWCDNLNYSNLIWWWHEKKMIRYLIQSLVLNNL